jgi:hypothetical protein
MQTIFPSQTLQEAGAKNPFSLLLDKDSDKMVVLDLTEETGSGDIGAVPTPASRDPTTHRHYLRRDSDAHFTPVSFSDGMCSDEIRLYYACLSSQAAGGTVSRLQRHRRLSTSAPQAERTHMSCLRAPKHNRQGGKGRSGSPIERQRRSSFTCVPKFSDDTSLPRSRSFASLDRDTKKVDFDDYVQIVTIYSHRDYPERTRSKLWMSRAERDECKKRGLADERIRLLDAPDVPPVASSPRAKATRHLERAPSIDSVIDEFLKSFTKDQPSPVAQDPQWRQS